MFEPPRMHLWLCGFPHISVNITEKIYYSMVKGPISRESESVTLKQGPKLYIVEYFHLVVILLQKGYKNENQQCII